jgi:hypothetical protein
MKPAICDDNFLGGFLGAITSPRIAVSTQADEMPCAQKCHAASDYTFTMTTST